MAENMTVVASDGTVTDYGSPGGEQLDGGSFMAGLIVGAALLLSANAWRKVRARIAARGDTDRDAERFDEDYAALAKRTATLERIVTEPAHRLDREIDALR